MSGDRDGQSCRAGNGPGAPGVAHAAWYIPRKDRPGGTLTIMFVSRGDRDLGVAFLMHPGSQSLSRGEAKDSALLSSRDAGLLEPPERPAVLPLQRSKVALSWRVTLTSTRKSRFLC